MIAKFHVVKDAQRRGYGRAIILGKLLPVVKEMGYKLIGVQTPSKKSIAFWKKVGFRVVGGAYYCELVSGGLKVLDEPLTSKRERGPRARYEPGDTLTTKNAKVSACLDVGAGWWHCWS